MPLFDLTKCYVVFQWNLECQKAFDQLKKTLTYVLVLVKPHFNKMFILDVYCSAKGVGIMLS